MAFVLHLLRPNDVFLDIGANVGSYTVLASGVCGARTLAFEPDQVAADRLRLNVSLNNIEGLVAAHQCALGDRDGFAPFTSGLDTVNRVSASGEQSVPLRRLDGIDGASEAVLIKLDVEGYEAQVLAGAGGVLASPTLIAIETENSEPDVVATLSSAGFARRWYDPATRTLSPDRVGLSQANALFVRDEAAVAERLASAPRRRVQGMLL